MKTLKTVKSIFLMSLIPSAMMSTAAMAENVVDPMVANVGPASDVQVGLQTLRWNMLDRTVNSLTFRSMDTLYSTRQVGRSGDVAELVKTEMPLDVSYTYNGEVYTIDDFLDRTYTNAMLVMKDGKIVYENYLNNMRPETRHMGWSMTKSIVSILVGIAHEEGRIKSLDQPITDYIPELSDSGYAGVTIRQVLEMTTGVGYEERYDFANPGVAARNHILALVKGVDRFAAMATELERKDEPGTVFEYKTIDTAVLGWLLERVLDGSNVASYAAQKIWEPLGAEQNGFFILDGEPGVGREFTGAGFNATLRDWARVGQMVANGGEFNGHRFVSEDYIKKATNPVLPEDPQMGGYGYQWWTMPNSNAFSAIGLQGQFVYIDPDTDTVIVKLSYFPQEEMMDLEVETLTFFDQISKWNAN